MALLLLALYLVTCTSSGQIMEGVAIGASVLLVQILAGGKGGGTC